MSGQIQAIDTTFNGGPPANKSDVIARTVEKWIAENKELSTAKWLSYNKVDQEHVTMLNVLYTSISRTKLHTSRNFNPAFIVSWMNP